MASDRSIYIIWPSIYINSLPLFYPQYNTVLVFIYNWGW